MKRIEIKIGGFGGQGIILSGYIIGKAASIYGKKNATLTQSYGPESRGGACSAQVIISEDEVDYPEVIKPDILILASQEAYEKYAGGLNNGGVLIYDEDLVKINRKLPETIKVYSIPATRLAEEMGKKIIANIILLGFFTAITGAIKFKSMEQSILSSIPKGTEEINLKAFQKGNEVGLEKMKQLI